MMTNKANVSHLETTTPTETGARVRLTVEVNYRAPRPDERIEDYASELATFVGLTVDERTRQVFLQWVEKYAEGTLEIQPLENGQAVLTYKEPTKHFGVTGSVTGRPPCRCRVAVGE